MTFTTGGPPPPGITWQALIFKQFGLAVDPQIKVQQNPDAAFNLSVTPTIGMRPPSKFRIHLAPMLAMSGGSETAGEFDMAVSPRLGFGNAPSTALTLGVTPMISMNGQEKERGMFALIVSPSLGMTAASNVVYDATGAGANGVSAAPSWAHVATPGAYVLALVTAAGATVTSAKYGSSAMSILGSIGLNNNPANGTVTLLGLANAPSGLTTISVNLSGSHTFTANSVSYTNVATVGTPTTSYGSSATPSLTAAGGGGKLIVCGFGAHTNAFSGSSGGTQRYTGGTTASLLIADSLPSTTFRGTLGASDVWGGIAVALNSH